jgi:hypothetical protein
MAPKRLSLVARQQQLLEQQGFSAPRAPSQTKGHSGLSHGFAARNDALLLKQGRGNATASHRRAGEKDCISLPAMHCVGRHVLLFINTDSTSMGRVSRCLRMCFEVVSMPDDEDDEVGVDRSEDSASVSSSISGTCLVAKQRVI